MALAFYFSPKVMSAEQYDQCIARLKKAGATFAPAQAIRKTLENPAAITQKTELSVQDIVAAIRAARPKE